MEVNQRAAQYYYLIVMEVYQGLYRFDDVLELYVSFNQLQCKTS
jgi:hypothetical protein